LIAAQAPANFQELSAGATTSREQGNLPLAIQLYTQALQLNPAWAEGWWFLGSLQYGSGSYASARDALSHYLGLTPNAPPALALRGLCEFETGEYSQALQDIQQGIAGGAASQQRNEQILRYHEGQLLTRLGRFDAALKSYSFFAEKKISSPELFLAIGLAGLHIPLLAKEASPDQQELVTAAGNATFQFMSGQDHDAGVFNALFQHFPTAANVHYLYGTLLYATDPDSAIEQFQKELEVSPENQAAQVMLPWALLMRNKPADALPGARMAAEKHPQLAAAQLVLGRALSETGALAEGIEHLETALKLEPTNLEIHIALAKTYSRAGRDEDARRERQSCLELAKGEATRIAQR
jgi:tetratricopeptide (TPR) repeat protein